ncbi:MAG: hypothetical protein N2258_07955 [Brevinematales bacterium]|nr:hypothetical protein [Brevinematales bacterium]
MFIAILGILTGVIAAVLNVILLNIRRSSKFYEKETKDKKVIDRIL